MGLVMTEGEIVRRYKNWPDKPKYAVQGLADLNGVDKYVIVEILYRNGAMNKASLAAYIRNGKCPDSLLKLFKEDGGEMAVPDTKDVKELKRIEEKSPAAAAQEKEGKTAAPVKKEITAAPEKKEETAADKVNHRDSSVIDGDVNHENRPTIVRAELPASVQALVAARLDELENAYKSAKQVVVKYEELTEYLKLGVPVTGKIKN